MTTTRTIETIVDQLTDQANPGTTVSATYSPLPRTGYLVGGEVPELVISRGERVGLAQPVERVTRWVAEHLALVAATPGLYYGSWYDQETGAVHYDVSRVVYETDRALWLASERGQIAIWDIARGVETGRVITTW